MSNNNSKNSIKKFALERDIIETSGVEAIIKFTDPENTVFLDIQELEKEAKNKQNRNRGAIEEVLKFLTRGGNNSFDAIKKEIHIGEGKKIHYDRELVSNKDNGFVHITKNPSRKSELLREGKKIDSPKFLTYGSETLKEGIHYLVSQKDPTQLKPKELESLIEKAQINQINNQYYIITGPNSQTAIWQLKYELNQLDEEGTRFLIDESSYSYNLISLEDIQSQSKIPGFVPRNLEQYISFNSICDPDCELIIISGGSGTGKTVSSYAGAINSLICEVSEEILEEDSPTFDNTPERMILFKADNIVGGKIRDPGFLPGGMDKKKEGIMESFNDAHKAIGLTTFIPYSSMLRPIQIQKPSKKQRRNNTAKGLTGEQIQTPPKKLINFRPNIAPIELCYLQFTRGRTFEKVIMYIDEAQNYTPYEIKQLIERAGRGSKIIISGDVEQIDDSSGRLDTNYNGLSFVVNTLFDEHPRMSIISFDKNYRLQSADIMRRKTAPRD